MLNKFLMTLLMIVILPDANAAVITYNFTAVVNGETFFFDDIPSVSEGDIFTGSFTVDTSAPPYAQSSTANHYLNAISNVSLDVGDFVITEQNPAPQDLTIRAPTNDWPTRLEIIASMTSNVVDNFRAGDIVFVFTAPGLEFTSDLQIPTSFDGIDTAGGFMQICRLGNDCELLSYSITELVPVPLPGALWMLLSGLGLIGLKRKSLKLSNNLN